MTNRDDQPGALALVESSIAEMRELVRLEFALAKDEFQNDLSAVRAAALLGGAAVVLAATGLACLLIAMGVALGPRLACILAMVLLAAAGALVYAAFLRLPRRPMASTMHRIEVDKVALKEHVS